MGQNDAEQKSLWIAQSLASQAFLKPFSSFLDAGNALTILVCRCEMLWVAGPRHRVSDALGHRWGWETRKAKLRSAAKSQSFVEIVEFQAVEAEVRDRWEPRSRLCALWLAEAMVMLRTCLTCWFWLKGCIERTRTDAGEKIHCLWPSEGCPSSYILLFGSFWGRKMFGFRGQTLQLPSMQIEHWETTANSESVCEK